MPLAIGTIQTTDIQSVSSGFVLPIIGKHINSARRGPSTEYGQKRSGYAELVRTSLKQEQLGLLAGLDERKT